ncbi:hypothetical protein PV328_003781 [Microctonus aethiopoides]|uniref:Chitin-binding type-2 domain-containing protein n=1 Tax=Microctonus aethiopoides TaxID=144406 RepID=A0AA39KKV9_9HYME|nr:hypothetical protein PV328_003781 [Microctonus aethiopoides]
MRTTASLIWIVYKLYFVVIIGGSIFNTLSLSAMAGFTCKNRDTGFYADIETNCQIYHTCDNHGNKFTYYCPQDTAFCQETLVCDHAYLVDCKKSAGLIAQVAEDSVDDPNKASINSEDTQNFNTYSRSYHISAQPSLFLVAPKQHNEDTTTFVMSSTVFLRDKSRMNNNQNTMNYKFLQKNYSSTTSSSVKFNQNQADKTEILKYEKSKNDTNNHDAMKNHRQRLIKPEMAIQYNNNNYPYIETLRSIQKKFTNEYISTTPKITTAGTEFPIPILGGTLAKFNNPDDDPYYPPQRITPEPHYTSITEKKNHKFFNSYVRRPWLTKLDLKIPDVLPDFNSLEDLVDRRKHLYISKTRKKFNS